MTEQRRRASAEDLDSLGADHVPFEIAADGAVDRSPGASGERNLGFDPYNTGAFDRSKAWRGVRRR